MWTNTQTDMWTDTNTQTDNTTYNSTQTDNTKQHITAHKSARHDIRQISGPTTYSQRRFTKYNVCICCEWFYGSYPRDIYPRDRYPLDIYPPRHLPQFNPRDSYPR